MSTHNMFSRRNKKNINIFGLEPFDVRFSEGNF